MGVAIGFAKHCKSTSRAQVEPHPFDEFSWLGSLTLTAQPQSMTELLGGVLVAWNQHLKASRQVRGVIDCEARGAGFMSPEGRARTSSGDGFGLWLSMFAYSTGSR